MDSGAWWATVHRVAKSQTRLSDFTFSEHTQKANLSFSLGKITKLSIQYCLREDNTPNLALKDGERTCKLKNSAKRGNTRPPDLPLE